VAIRGCVIQKDIENNGIEIVAKFIRKESRPKTSNFYFAYFYNGKYYETAASGVKHSILNSKRETTLINELKLNHYYSAKFEPKHLKNIIVNLSKEILDSTEIRKAGF
jgi:hypothetical protein